MYACVCVCVFRLVSGKREHSVHHTTGQEVMVWLRELGTEIDVYLYSSKIRSPFLNIFLYSPPHPSLFPFCSLLLFLYLFFWHQPLPLSVWLIPPLSPENVSHRSPSPLSPLSLSPLSYRSSPPCCWRVFTNAA